MQTVIHTLFGNVPTVAWKLEDKMPQDLKPCPFCGGNAVVNGYDGAYDKAIMHLTNPLTGDDL
jgi:hypothetical protein